MVFNENQVEEIRLGAKKLLDKFSAELDKIKIAEVKVEREKDRRIEGSEQQPMDRKIMFANAPDKDGDYLRAEMGGWV